MYLNGKITLCLILLFFTLISCTSTGELAESASNSRGVPAWYQQSGFESDSLNYSGFATAVAADSLLAIERAEEQARANLENHIAQKLEDIRIQLEENGSLKAIDPDFIITLRNSHAAVEDEADISDAAAIFRDGFYRGFAKATIQKSAVISLLESGFEGKSQLWQELSSSEYFASEMQ